MVINLKPVFALYFAAVALASPLAPGPKLDSTSCVNLCRTGRSLIKLTQGHFAVMRIKLEATDVKGITSPTILPVMPLISILKSQYSDKHQDQTAIVLVQAGALTKGGLGY